MGFVRALSDSPPPVRSTAADRATLSRRTNRHTCRTHLVICSALKDGSRRGSCIAPGACSDRARRHDLPALPESAAAPCRVPRPCVPPSDRFSVPRTSCQHPCLRCTALRAFPVINPTLPQPRLQTLSAFVTSSARTVFPSAFVLSMPTVFPTPAPGAVPPYLDDRNLLLLVRVRAVPHDAWAAAAAVRPDASAEAPASLSRPAPVSASRSAGRFPVASAPSARVPAAAAAAAAAAARTDGGAHSARPIRAGQSAFDASQGEEANETHSGPDRTLREAQDGRYTRPGPRNPPQAPRPRTRTDYVSRSRWPRIKHGREVNMAAE